MRCSAAHARARASPSGHVTRARTADTECGLPFATMDAYAVTPSMIWYMRMRMRSTWIQCRRHVQRMDFVYGITDALFVAWALARAARARAQGWPVGATAAAPSSRMDATRLAPSDPAVAAALTRVVACADAAAHTDGCGLTLRYGHVEILLHSGGDAAAEVRVCSRVRGGAHAHKHRAVGVLLPMRTSAALFVDAIASANASLSPDVAAALDEMMTPCTCLASVVRARELARASNVAAAACTCAQSLMRGIRDDDFQTYAAFVFAACSLP